MGDSTSRVSSPLATGGAGFALEIQVQAAYVILMLTGGFSPGLNSPWPITRIRLQGNGEGHKTDDFIAFAKEPHGPNEAKLLAQIKRTITITQKDKTFGEVICAAWADFNDRTLFDPDRDAIALITGPLSATDTKYAMTLPEIARTSVSAHDFLSVKIALSKQTSNLAREKLDAFRTQLDIAKGTPVTDDELYKFMRSYYLLSYDLEGQNRVVVSLLRSLIRAHAPENWEGLWDKVVTYVLNANPLAGTITKESLPKEITERFLIPQLRQIPPDFTEAAPFVKHALHTSFSSPDDLASALVIGEWDDQSEADSSAIELFTKSPYAAWIPSIRNILESEDSPLLFRNNHWEVRDRLELWKALGPRVFPRHLDHLKILALNILKNNHPVPISGQGKRRDTVPAQYSKYIRSGIASTLAILGNHQGLLTRCTATQTERVVVLTVRETLQGADWGLWTSLDDVLPLLAEAAPTEFLDALEQKISEDVRGSVSCCDSTGLMWALESLAWESELFVRVIVTLGQLASLDPDQSPQSRPLRSLTTILLPWFPQTFATPETQEKATDYLSREYPEVAWRLLLTLLPGRTPSSSGSYKPKWRPRSPEDYNVEVTPNQYRQQVDCYSRLALSLAKTCADKLNKLLVDLHKLLPETQRLLLDHIASDEVRSFAEGERAKLFDALDTLVLRHRRHSDAQWALPSHQLDDIQQIAEEIAPTSPAQRFYRLFSDEDYELLDGKGDFPAQQVRLDERRRDIVAQLLQQKGLTPIVELAKNVRSPRRVGEALGLSDDGACETEVLPAMLTHKEKALASFAQGYVRGRFMTCSWPWVDKADTKHWPPSQKGQFLACLPFSPETWTRVSRLLPRNERTYWTYASVNTKEAKDDLRRAAKCLIKFRRPYDALSCIYAMRDNKEQFEPLLAVTALDAALKSSIELTRFNGYVVVPIIEKLQETETVSYDDLARIEWGFLELLIEDRDSRPITLERRLGRNPAFFCEVIRKLYRSKREFDRAQEPSQEQQKQASKASTLFVHWKLPPGCNDDNSFDEHQFMSWLSEVKTACDASGHLEPALSQIGHVLRYCPEGADGLWLPRSVAEALDAPDADSMRDGYYCEWFNSRGTYSPTGGREERDLERRYEERAQAVEEYPRLATTLRELALTYKREAQRQIDCDFN